MFGLCAAAAPAEGFGTLPQPQLLTNLFQLRRCAEQEPAVAHSFRIVADVCDADCAAGVLALRDASGMEFIQLNLQGQEIKPGATVCLEANGYACKPKSFGLAGVPGMVVDNDGLHANTLKTGGTVLRAGINPIRVQWFNGIGNFNLSVEFEGPGLPRQPIPASALLRATVDSAKDKTNFSTGLDYRCYEGSWGRLPDFAKLQPARTGVATNFDLGVRTRNEHVALEFNGFINVPKAGAYTFYVASDDGSRLFAGEPSLKVFVLSNGPVPTVVEKVPATAAERNRRPWVTLEGTVNFAGIWSEGGELQMRVGKDDIRVAVFQNGDSMPNFPPQTKVRVSGIYEDVVTDDGTQIPGMLLVSSWQAVQAVPSSGIAATGDTGFFPGTTNSTLAIVSDIKALTPDQAKQRLPVSIRGVVTASLPSFRGAVVQDSTRGIFVSLQELKESESLQRGEFCEIGGVTDPGLFAPLIVAHRIDHLGTGRLPQPLHATWDQLMNGSLDTQYAEIEGAVITVDGQQIVMLTEGGKITLEINEFKPEVLAGYENARIRIRGCVFGPFNGDTRRLELGSLPVASATVQVLQAAPGVVFGAPQKSIGELSFYDPQTAPFRLLKVSGQVIYGKAGGYFLTDGTNGMHVTTRKPDHFAVGDKVDAVGFLELGGPVAELTEAVMRKTAAAPLPTPTLIAPDHLLRASHAGTLIQVRATLMNHWLERSESVLELQSGFLAFRARIDSGGHPAFLPPSGSRLELTGVYAPQGKGLADGNVSGFDLLLSSPAGVRILSTPPWWNLKRVLILAGILAALLCGVLVWNRELHRKVQERGRQLELEINNRQQAELKHAAEAERSRIARDLHDELGTGLTEVSLLASTGLGEFQGVEKKSDRFRVIADKARDLVSGLDVIVWAIDPKHNTLQSFTDYLESYTKELLAASDIVCRFRIPIECGTVTLAGTVRHSLLLAIKEALNNMMRHASAAEVELQVAQFDDHLEIVIADNGRGFDPVVIRRGHGLANLHDRLEALGGHCHVESQPGKGTTIKFIVPLPRSS